MERWRSLLDEMVALRGEARDHHVWAHPELLAASVQVWLAADVDGGGGEAERAALGELRRLRERLEARQQDFVAGRAPLELLWVRANRGELTQEAAQELASEAWEATLAEPYVDAVSVMGRKMMEAGNAGQAVELMQLLLAALDARPGGPLADEPGRYACLRYTTVVRQYLLEMADGRVFRHADRVGRQVLEWARAESDAETEADALGDLGLLHLNPYTGGRRSTNLEHDLYLWQQRFVEVEGVALRDVPLEEWSMPPVREALSTAFDLLVEAAALREGAARGATLKQAAEAAVVNKTLGEKLDRERVVGILREALELIDPGQLPEDYLAALNLLRILDSEADATMVVRVLDLSVDEWVRRLQPLGALGLLRQAGILLREADPPRAHECLRKARSLAAVLGDNQVRVELWLDDLNTLFAGRSEELKDVDPPTDLAATAEELRGRAAEEGWDTTKLAVSLLWLAGIAPQVGEERPALALLDEVEAMVPVLVEEFREALAYQRAILHLGLGVNGFHAKDFDDSLREYLEALGMFVELDAPGKALDVLRRIDDLARHGAEAGVLDVVLGLASLALRLESSLGEPATHLLQQIYKHALARMVDGTVNPEALLILGQVAKGLRFGVQLGSEAAFAWEDDERGRDLLGEIGRLEAALGETPPEEPTAALDEGLLLTPYTASGARSGDETVDRLTNLRRAYDRRLHERLLTGAGTPLLLDQQTIQSSLDERTVLLSVYLGATAAGNLAVLSTVITADDLLVNVVDLNVPDQAVELVDRGRRFETSGFAPLVQSVREELRVAPDPWPLTPAARELLETTEPWFGGLFGELEKLRSGGMDHLCIVPHGSAHAFPFHLLHHQGVPLAERWAVSYLPSTRLLLSRPGPPTARTARRVPAAVLALDYEGGRPHGLVPLPQAREEAKAIAAAHGVEALVNEDVTEAAVKGTLGRARVVHIAAHGRHDVEAPAFQCLYVAPEDGSDGVLRAHELLAQDMRATEIVTLSACETALGRFDLVDNPRGLPATLLLAGVSTIVGTLWPVETNASAAFFTFLHSSLAAGTPRLDAFVEAQRETRSHFPAYRDWGAFQFVGDWLEPVGSAG